MAITKDKRGNHYVGNSTSGSPWDVYELLKLIRTATGSDLRANINFANLSKWRIDWRTNENTTEENMSGTVEISPAPVIEQYSSSTAGRVLAANARFAMSMRNEKMNNAQQRFSPWLMSNAPFTSFVPLGEPLTPSLTSAAQWWGVARDSMVAFFVKDGDNHFFLSQGLLLEAELAFPGSQYSIAARGSTHRIRATVQNGSLELKCATFGTYANYDHVRKSNDTAMTAECELYLRNQSDGVNYGYCANLFKLHVDAGETTPVVGDFVVLNMSLASGYYEGLNEIMCIVVARLGDKSDIDAGGDYILMKVSK